MNLIPVRSRLCMSQVYAVVIRCKACDSIKELDQVSLYRYDANRRLTEVEKTLTKGETVEIITCPLK